MARGKRSRAWILLLPALLLVSVVVPWALAQRVSTRSEREPRATVSEPPQAVAPPDTGIEPPAVQVLSTGQQSPQRPQQQLAGWAASMSDRLNIPRAALEAYGYADRATRASHPNCGMSWTVLAGVASVESGHGRIGGARLDSHGRTTIPIRGIPLDGSTGVKHIPDSDRGALDGDPQFDRAVGPLQFIPQTWQRWARDADGDGIADPHDIDDAALTASRYLCSVGGNLRNPDHYWAALFEYNESRSYGQLVLNYADHYGRLSRGIVQTG